MITKPEPLEKEYEAWFHGVGEVMIGSFSAKSHKEARKFIYSQIVIRRVKDHKPK